MPGAAFSPDGTEMVFAYPRGLWHADVAALRQGSDSVEQYSASPFWGLIWTPDGLYAGGWQYGLEPSTQFTVGVSHDGGRHFSPLFDVCDTVIGCGGTGGPAECATPVETLRANLIDGERCKMRGAEPPPAVDGGILDGGSTHRQTDIGARGVSRGAGCACVVGRAAGTRGGLGALLAAVAALTARSRSKAPQSSSKFERFRLP
jgi:hypothetical protein